MKKNKMIDEKKAVIYFILFLMIISPLIIISDPIGKPNLDERRVYEIFLDSLEIEKVTQYHDYDLRETVKAFKLKSSNELYPVFFEHGTGYKDTLLIPGTTIYKERNSVNIKLIRDNVSYELKIRNPNERKTGILNFLFFPISLTIFLIIAIAMPNSAFMINKKPIKRTRI
jgi:hypothetical protein